MHCLHNGGTVPPFACSEQLTLCAKLGLPHLVLTLAGEDQAVPVELGLPPYVDVGLCAVADGLQVVRLTTDFDCATLGHDGVDEVAHDGSFQLGVTSTRVSGLNAWVRKVWQLSALPGAVFL
jgi:hypothetical protein